MQPSASAADLADLSIVLEEQQRQLSAMQQQLGHLTSALAAQQQQLSLRPGYDASSPPLEAWPQRQRALSRLGLTASPHSTHITSPTASSPARKPIGECVTCQHLSAVLSWRPPVQDKPQPNTLASIQCKARFLTDILAPTILCLLHSPVEGSPEWDPSTMLLVRPPQP